MRPALLSLLTCGCGLLDAGADPAVEAHRGAAGYWPQNSRAAMLGSIDAGYDGLEFDLVLTSDDVPVLSHDPWLHEELCTTVAGELLGERVLIQELDLASLQADYLCGGEPDPDNPDAEVLAETVMTFDELLDAIVDAPDMLFHIDIKYEPGDTPEPAAFAEQVMDRFWAADLPNPSYVSANLPELLGAFESYGDDNGYDVVTSLAWPRFPPDTNNTAIALSHELATTVGVEELVALAREGGADGLAIPYQVLDRQQVELARQEGLQIQVWTVNDEALLQRFQRWPLDSIITDYPDFAR